MISTAFLATTLVVVLIPGTGVLFTLSVALGQGRKAAFWAALGCTFGIVPSLAAAIFGLAAILHSSALLFAAVKWAGAAYLLYLAWSTLNNNLLADVEQDARPLPGWKTASRAALLNMLNPKLTLFFMSLLPPFLSGNADTARVEMLTLGAVFMAMTFAVFMLYGAFAALARTHILQSPGINRWLNRGFAAVFAGLGLKLALEKA